MYRLCFINIKAYSNLKTYLGDFYLSLYLITIFSTTCTTSSLKDKSTEKEKKSDSASCSTSPTENKAETHPEASHNVSQEEYKTLSHNSKLYLLSLYPNII